MLIGILQTGRAPEALRPDHGDYPDLFIRLLDGQGFDFRIYPVLDGIFPDGPQECDGWLITGSRHGVYEDHDWLPLLEDFIRAVHAAGVPMVGICFGHQIIAQALGGRVEKYAGGWSIGPTSYDWGDGVVTLNAWHQDQVVTAPAGARRIATSGFCENAALAYGDSILTLQAHPEFDRAFTRDMIDKRGPGVVPDPLLDRAQERLESPVDDRMMGDRIARFFLDHEGQR